MAVQRIASLTLLTALIVVATLFSTRPAMGATLPVTVVLSPASVMLGSDTISLGGNTFNTTLDSTTVPAAQFPVGSFGLTASAATAPGRYEGLLNQTVTVNGAATVITHFVSLTVTGSGVHGASIGAQGLYNLTVPEGVVTMGTFGTGVTVPAAPGNNTTNYTEAFSFTPLPTAPNQFLVYSTYAYAQVGGLTGNLFGGMGPSVVTLTPNVPSGVGWNQFTNYQALGSGSPGASTQAQQTFTVQGVSQTITRTATLIPAAFPDCPNDTHLSFSPATTMTFDLGARGKVDLTIAIAPHFGENYGPPNCTAPGVLTVIPGTTVPILLHSVPAVSPAPGPASTVIATVVPTATPTSVPPAMLPVLPQGVQNPAAIGIFGPGNRATPAPRTGAPAAPSGTGAQQPSALPVLRPPSTGDAGLVAVGHRPNDGPSA